MEQTDIDKRIEKIEKDIIDIQNNNAVLYKNIDLCINEYQQQVLNYFKNCIKGFHIMLITIIILLLLHIFFKEFPIVIDVMGFLIFLAGYSKFFKPNIKDVKELLGSIKNIKE